MKVFNNFIFILINTSFASTQQYFTEDVFVPKDCVKIAKAGDHLLIEYTVVFENGTYGPSLTQPEQLYHVLLESSDELPVQQSLKGMCENATRKIIWEDSNKFNIMPVFLRDTKIRQLNERVAIDIRLVHITDSTDYQIFDAFKQGNISFVLDIIDSHKGVNAVDEWGQTALIIAVNNNNLEVISSLLNTRRPKVDINIAKSSGFTAIFYAVERSGPSILQALLRRGGDPNVSVLQKGSIGNTPLHYACLFEKVKHAELLIEYGANPYAINEYGQTPLQLLPKEAVLSNKLRFKKMFEDAKNKLQSSLSSGSRQASNHRSPVQAEL